MDNEALKEAFQALHTKITKNVDPDSAIDELYAKKLISATDNRSLYDIPDTKSRCRKFLALLHDSSHPETFIRLREALHDEYPSIVDEVDKNVGTTPETAQLQQLQLDQPTDGKFLY